jgi:hypothetical protein
MTLSNVSLVLLATDDHRRLDLLRLHLLEAET